VETFLYIYKSYSYGSRLAG